ncbi:cupin domain-containing protein [Streptomyces zagrosensis]|uniref:Mannose-6-phosphate isomerase-like protein (Cupin superfamily) n=1 Tax=Streptomyces zagrosensis TaxID=1042984 RepID=A0A7W9QH57_9ACTN|nr:cupin domain-containing protein [Streptomyces zagrosensis]MBB5939132.1 mannose-6-phosphate isomerase-like protein (cupin superfamily) [Streptomyces zagrosensis]
MASAVDAPNGANVATEGDAVCAAGRTERDTAAAGSRRLAVISLRQAAAGPPRAWCSRVVGRVGEAAVKVLRMSELPVAEESHDVAEALLVLDGTLALEVRGELVTVRTGDLFMVPARTPHRVRPGSEGTLLIVENEPVA